MTVLCMLIQTHTKDRLTAFKPLLTRIEVPKVKSITFDGNPEET